MRIFFCVYIFEQFILEMIIEQPPYIYRMLYPETIWRIPRREKTVYLTFDDGPIPEVTPWVLNVLDQYNIKGTFFCVGDNVALYKELYNEIMAEKNMSRWWVLILVSFANAAFCRLFMGDVWAMGVVVVATLVGFFIRQEMMRHHVNHHFVFVTSAFVASLIGSLSIFIPACTTPQIALATSVLYLIPGVPLINSIIDIIEGHVLVGFTRFVNACMLIICIAVGLSSTLLLIGIDSL